MVSRRAFIKSSGLALFGIGLGGIPSFITEALAHTQAPGLFKKRKVLVCIFQRGAMDGLMAVSPFTDPYLQALRPNLWMSAVAGKGKPLIDLDGRFGLHPAMGAFERLYRNKQLAIVHGIGSPNETRSHFDAQDYMESGTPFSKNTSSGWLNRAVGLLGHEAASPFQGVSLTSALPRSFYGNNPAIAIRNLADFNVQLKGNQPGAQKAAQSFEDLYDEASSDLLKNTGKESFEAIKILKKTISESYKPEANVIYPNTALGNALKQIAQLIKMDVGMEIAFAESGGWDTHFNQGAETGIFARNVNDLSNSIVAFWNDMEKYQDEVMLMTMTEFGRTVAQNGTGGTDHGRASCNFIIGNALNGAKVHGQMQPLTKENLSDGRDLPVTTDFRSVFSEVADKHLGLANDKILFPDWNGQQIGLFRGGY